MGIRLEGKLDQVVSAIGEAKDTITNAVSTVNRSIGSIGNKSVVQV